MNIRGVARRRNRSIKHHIVLRVDCYTGLDWRFRRRFTTVKRIPLGSLGISPNVDGSFSGFQRRRLTHEVPGVCLFSRCIRRAAF